MTGVEATSKASSLARPGERPHAFLRRVTRPWHEAVERGFAPFDLADRDGYAAFLERQAMALLPLEASLTAADAAGWWAAWRPRAPALLADLDRLGVMRPPALPVPTLSGVPQRVGVLYVLEGARLGGRMLSRDVKAAPDSAVRDASTFLSQHPDRGWTAFLAVLDAVPLHDGGRALATGAKIAFDLFLAAATLSTIDDTHAGPSRSGLLGPAYA